MGEHELLLLNLAASIECHQVFTYSPLICILHESTLVVIIRRLEASDMVLQGLSKVGHRLYDIII